jgi:nucleotide-binding universal stress UspA family protein
MFERVVIAIDGSPPPEVLVGATLAVTHPRHTEVTVLSVYHTPPEGTTSAQTAAGNLQQAGYRAHAQVQLVERGGVAEEIIRFVDEHGPDLLVMGSRGLTDLEALVKGSVTHQVLANVVCPVLIAREGAGLDPPRRLLLAFDDSSHSRRAARVAVDLACATGAEIEVLTVARPILAADAVVLDTADSSRRLEQLVAGLRREVVASGCVKVSTRGRAATIAQSAEEAGADLIVMGTRGLSRIAGAVIGSVSHEVIHLSNRQVLLVP